VGAGSVGTGADSVIAACWVGLAVGAGAAVSSALSPMQALKTSTSAKLNPANNVNPRDLRTKLCIVQSSP
jgi:hypothetical protein